MSNTKPSTEFLEKSIHLAIKKEVAKITEKHTEEACEQLRQKLAELVSGIALRVMENVSFEKFGTDLRITILNLEK